MITISQERFWIKSYDSHIPKKIEYPNEDLGTILINSMEQRAEKIGIYFMDSIIKYSEILDKSRRFATFLQQNGLEKGDIVAMNIPNTPQYIYALYGTLIAGGTTTGLSPLLSHTEMAYQLNDCKAKFVITLDIIYEKVFPKFLNKTPDLKVIIPTNVSEFMGFGKFKVFMGKLIKKIPKGKMNPWPGKKVVPFLEALETPDQLKKVRLDSKKDLAVIQYTGGTTGLPKGTEITHFNLAANMKQFDTWLERDGDKEVNMTAFPYFHIAGLFISLFLTYIGATHIMIANPRDTDHMIDEIIKHKPTSFGNVPTLFLLLQRNPKAKTIPKVDLERISLWISGAAPFPAEAVRDFERAFHTENKFVEVYGMTESAVLVTVNPVHGKKKIGKVGLPLPDTDVKLIDLDTGEEVPLGEPGEILLKGPQITKQYLNKPEATAKTYVDGWLHTGDVGVFDEDGYLQIVDRTKDMLIVSGFKVYSVHVEDVMTQHSSIELMAIIGIPNPERPGAEIVKAVIQLKEGVEENDNVKADIKKYAEEKLSKYEVPKIWEFVEELPTTMVGKVLKRALREEKKD